MCIIAWFWFFVAVFFAICACVIGCSSTKKDAVIKRLNQKIAASDKQLEFYREKEFKENFFDFEKVNSKKEK